jgi:hypothetical protein
MNYDLILGSYGIEGKSVLRAVNAIGDGIRSSRDSNKFAVGVINSFGVVPGKTKVENEILAKAAVEFVVKMINENIDPSTDEIEAYAKDRLETLRIEKPELFEGDVIMIEQKATFTEPAPVAVESVAAGPVAAGATVAEAPKKRGRKPDLARHAAVERIIRENAATTPKRGDIVRMVEKELNTTYVNARAYVVKAEVATGITLVR